MTVFFDDQLLFTFTGTSFSGPNFDNSGLIPVSDLAGQTGRLAFALNSVGARNAAFSLQNVTVSSLAAAVPEPEMWVLMIFGFGAIGVKLRIRERGRQVPVKTMV
jgi:hypothetical protein